MEKKQSVFNYLIQVFMIYGIANVLLNLFALIFGESAEEISTIFSMGNDGVGAATCFQFLLAMFLIVGIEYLFTSDSMIKLLPMMARMVLLLGLALGVITGFILMFDWFPAGEFLPWAMFLLCFIISFVISVAVSSAYEKQESRKMEEALKKYKEENPLPAQAGGHFASQNKEDCNGTGGSGKENYKEI